MTTIEKQRGVATGSALRKADSLAGQQLKRELGKPVPLLHLVSHDSLHFFGVLRRRPIPRSQSRAACIFRPMITTTSPVGNPRMFVGVPRVVWSGRPAYGYRAFSLTPVIPVGAGIRRPFYHREHKERRVFCIGPGDARTSVTLTRGWPIVLIPVRRRGRDSAGPRGLGREGGLRCRGGCCCPGTSPGICGPP